MAMLLLLHQAQPLRAATALESPVEDLNDGSLVIGTGMLWPMRTSLWQEVAYGSHLTSLRATEAEIQALISVPRRRDASTYGGDGFVLTLASRYLVLDYILYRDYSVYPSSYFASSSYDLPATTIAVATNAFNGAKRTHTRSARIYSSTTFYGSGNLRTTSFAILCPLFGDVPGLSRTGGRWTTVLSAGIGAVLVDPDMYYFFSNFWSKSYQDEIESEPDYALWNFDQPPIARPPPAESSTTNRNFGEPGPSSAWGLAVKALIGYQPFKTGWYSGLNFYASLDYLGVYGGLGAISAGTNWTFSGAKRNEPAPD